MHSRRNRRARWNLLSLILLLAVGGLALDHKLHFTPTGHKIALLLTVAVIYGLIGLWLRFNAAALHDLDDMEYRKQSRDPSVYGTLESPTRTQLHYREITSFYRPASPDRREGPQP